MRKNETSKKDRAIAKKYFLELGLALGLYMVTLIGSIYFYKTMEAGTLRTLVVMTPTLPGLGALFAITRAVNSMDDYGRTRMLEVMALSGGITAFLAFSYGFLEGIGYPKLSGFVTYVVFMMGWFVIGLIRNFLEREKKCAI